MLVFTAGASLARSPIGIYDYIFLIFIDCFCVLRVGVSSLAEGRGELHAENLTRLYAQLGNSDRTNCSKDERKEMKALKGAGYCKQGELKGGGRNNGKSE
jgi:hypothetical protein